jgi:hypothetical protein
MKNYEMIEQWLATLNTAEAMTEITNLRLKYPWLKCNESYLLIDKMHKDLKKIAGIIKLQEKNNAIHQRFIEVNQMADEAIVKAITAKYNL